MIDPKRLLYAARNAQPEIQHAIERLIKMPVFDRMLLPAPLYWLLGPDLPGYKLSKEDTFYTDKTASRQKCANCISSYRHVTTGQYTCDQIAGIIQPSGWCNHWQKPVTAETFAEEQEK